MAKSKAQQLLFQAAGWNLTGSQSAMLQAQAAAAAALQGKFSELQKTSLALANVFGLVEGKIKGMVSAGLAGRSEERRVGKGGRSRGGRGRGQHKRTTMT